MCHAWAGGRAARAERGIDGSMSAGYAAQGNLLAGAEVVDALAETFEQNSSLPTWNSVVRRISTSTPGAGWGGESRGTDG